MTLTTGQFSWTVTFIPHWISIGIFLLGCLVDEYLNHRKTTQNICNIFLVPGVFAAMALPIVMAEVYVQVLLMLAGFYYFQTGQSLSTFVVGCQYRGLV